MAIFKTTGPDSVEPEGITFLIIHTDHSPMFFYHTEINTKTPRLSQWSVIDTITTFFQRHHKQTSAKGSTTYSIISTWKTPRPTCSFFCQREVSVLSLNSPMLPCCSEKNQSSSALHLKVNTIDLSSHKLKRTRKIQKVRITPWRNIWHFIILLTWVLWITALILAY